jgi:hypothetical protein
LFTVLKTRAVVGLIFANLSVPAITSVRATILENNFQLNAVKTNLAISAYKQDHGQLPPDLQVLVPSYLDTLPTDPFQETTPLSYRPDNSITWLIYSVGFDQIDNHGQPIPSPKPSKVKKIDQKGDLVISGSIPH